ncbi:MAG: hypothetical protein Q7V57_05305 [Actinomycetota bacterium]|nr:hypothetical protein [Actinomycetota bacterium]
MGYEVHMVVELRKPPTEALMSELDHKFEVAAHDHGTKTVSITEHVSVNDEADAIAFVQALVMDAMPDNAKVVSVVAEAD